MTHVSKFGYLNMLLPQNAIQTLSHDFMEGSLTVPTLEPTSSRLNTKGAGYYYL